MGGRSSNVVSFRSHRRRRWGKRAPAKDGWFVGLAVALPVLVLAGTLVSNAPAPQRLAIADRERAYFPLCGGAQRSTCVIDGDTIRYRGDKIRIADINTPEVSEPACPREAALGQRATVRLQGLLNDGAFTLGPNPDGRAQDKYGRSLFVITRAGESIGRVLVEEGLAETWRGYRGNWC